MQSHFRQCSGAQADSYCGAGSIIGNACSLTFDFGAPIRPLTHVGSGFLSGMGARPADNGAANYVFSVPDKYLLPIKPHGFRAGDSLNAGDFASDLYPWLKSRGFTEIQVLLMATLDSEDGVDVPMAQAKCEYSSPTVFNCSQFEQRLANRLSKFANMTGISFDIWNELQSFGPEHSRSGFDEFFVTWRAAVRTIRRLRPGTEIVGPSSTGPVQDAVYHAGGYSNFSFTWEFLRAAKQADVLPDVFSWHDGLSANLPNYPQPPSWIGNGSEMVSAARQLRQFIAANDMGNVVKKLSVNEYGNYWDVVPPLPAIHVSYFANFERAGISSAMKSCWYEHPYNNYDTCENATLNGLLTMEPLPRPRSVWWVFEAYGAMSGMSLAAQHRSRHDIDGMGALDFEACDSAVFLVGYFPQGSVAPHARPGTGDGAPSGNELIGNGGGGRADSPPKNTTVTVTLKRLPSCLRPRGMVRLAVDYIPRSGAGTLGPLLATQLIVNARLEVAGDGSLALSPLELEYMAALKLTVVAVV